MKYLLQQALSLPFSPLVVSAALLVLTPLFAVVFRIRKTKELSVLKLSRFSLISGALLSPAAICQVYWGARAEPFSATSVTFPTASALLSATCYLLLVSVGLLSLAIATPRRSRHLDIDGAAGDIPATHQSG
jgi:hypothetical protein